MRQSPLAAAAHVCCVLPPGHYVLCIKAGWSNHLLTPIIVMYLNSKSYLHFVYPDAVTLHIRTTVILLKCVTLSHQSVIGILTPKMKILTLEPYTAVNRSSSEHVSCYESGFHSLRIFDFYYSKKGSSRMAIFIKNGRLWLAPDLCRVHFLH